MLTRKSLFLTSKSEMLTRKSLLLTSKSDMLARKSLFLIADVEPRKCFYRPVVSGILCKCRFRVWAQAHRQLLAIRKSCVLYVVNPYYHVSINGPKTGSRGLRFASRNK